MCTHHLVAQICWNRALRAAFVKSFTEDSEKAEVEITEWAWNDVRVFQTSQVQLQKRVGKLSQWRGPEECHMLWEL